MTTAAIPRIEELLGNEAESLLNYRAKVDAAHLHVPGPDFIERVWEKSDRSPQVMRSLAALFGNGRLGGSGYVSILPVDQGIEHAGGASFAKNPIYFDGENIVKLAIEGG
ncbi:MAG: fructose-bisphosphate aldolase, partial [Planctomycetes bacterium]|nr:fructose-bisphosphate aldolase [Planctomycetota bacterium]